MSYNTRRGRGLGAVPAPGPIGTSRGVPRLAPPQGLPPWESATDAASEQIKQEETYRRTGDDGVLNLILQRLVDFYAISPLDAMDTNTGHLNARRLYGSHWEIREDGPFLQALKSFWVREGRNDHLWPGSGGQYDFGPNANASTDLQISKQLYNMLISPSTPLWAPVGGDNGYVRLRNQDYFWQHYIHDALVQQGYLAAAAEINTKDDGPMVRALRSFYNDGMGVDGTKVGFVLDYGEWPGGVNYGPNTNGDEVRINPKLIIAVLNGWSKREVDARNAAVGWLSTATIRAPLYGLPSQDVATQRKLSLPASALTVSAVVNQAQKSAFTLMLPKK